MRKKLDKGVLTGELSDKRKYLEEKLGIFEGLISENKLRQFLTFYDILIEWNSFMNLTAITDFEEVVLKHFLDSIMIFKYTDIEKDAVVLDFGTGAGFPGIPLKIVRPDLKITLMDSLNKRIKFLDEVIIKLGFNNITTIHGRGEELGKKAEFRQKYDFVLSRAVARLSTLSECCLPFVKKGGYFISYKSGGVGEEVKESETAVKILGGSKAKVEYFKLYEDTERSFVKIKKTGDTPEKYPRGGGKPFKEPLGES